MVVWLRLQSWKRTVFVTREAEDIHYLDKTFLSSIAQLQMMLLSEPSDQIGDDEVLFE
ncbi:MAG: hypothetical protein JXK05_07915 [Campylobacterales bacterium]|nr:hypothetical protein [Campylobacterales bacterium]